MTEKKPQAAARTLAWVAGIIVVIVAAWLVASRVPTAPSPFRIGAVLPLTGSAAVWGQNAQRGMDLALDELNAARPASQKLSILYEDSRSDTNAAVSALQKLISSDRVEVVIGDIASSAVLAMAPIAEKNKVLLLSPGASNPEISKAGEYTFRNWQSDALEGQVGARFAYSERRWRRVATLFVSNAYGTGLNQEFTAAFSGLGGTIVGSETFNQGAVDLRAQITRLKENGRFDAVYLAGYPPEMAVALKQMKQLGLSTPILSVQAFDDPEIFSRAGRAAEGVIFSVPKPPDEAVAIVSQFRKNYTTRFDKKPGVCSDTGYDALRIIAWALDQGARTGTDIQESLRILKDFPGAAGTTTFDALGDVSRPFVFKVIRSGAAVNLLD